MKNSAARYCLIQVYLLPKIPFEERIAVVSADSSIKENLRSHWTQEASVSSKTASLLLCVIVGHLDTVK